MYNYKCIIEYDGSRFCGFQSQINKNTIEDFIKDTLFKLFKKDIKIIYASRTDKGVHARHQVINFYLDFYLNEENLKNSLNNILLPNILFKKIEIVENDFHSRYFVEYKIYNYKIITKNPTVFDLNYYGYYENINYKLLKKSFKEFIGYHDFFVFSSEINKNKNSFKCIDYIKVSKRKNIINIDIKSKGFLKYQIRKMVMAAINISTGKDDIYLINKMFETQDKTLLKKIADPRGLYLYYIEYKK